MPNKNAREIATKIYYSIGNYDSRFLEKNFQPNLYTISANFKKSGFDDEKEIISQFKKLKSKGQVSQVASAYANSPLNYGDLSQDVTDALTGWTDSDTYITQLTTYIDSLPN